MKKAMMVAGAALGLTGCQWPQLTDVQPSVVPVIEAQLPECFYLAMNKLQLPPETPATNNAAPQWQWNDGVLQPRYSHAWDELSPYVDLPALAMDIAWECNNLLHSYYPGSHYPVSLSIGQPPAA